MKKFLIVFLAIPIIGASLPRIKKIDIYPGGARLYMQGLIPQSGTLEIGPLPKDLTDIVISLPDYKVNYRENSALPEKVLKIKSEYQKLKSELNSLKRKDFLLKQKRDFYLSAIINYAKRFAKGKVINWENILSSLTARLENAGKESSKLKKEIEVTQKKFNEIKEKWEKIREKIGKTAYITIKGNPGEKFPFEFSTSSLSWKTYYSFHANIKAKTLNLESFLVLSSALPFDTTAEIYLVPKKPSYYSKLPEQQRWSISLFKPFIYRARKVGMPTTPKLIEAKETIMAKNVIRPTPVTRGFYRMVFLGKKSLVFGRNRVQLFSENLNPEIIWQAFPALSNKVFVVAKAKNTTGFHIIPAEALFFVDGTFTRKAFLEDIPENGKMKLLLGYDPSFKIKYKKSVVKRNEGIRKNSIIIERNIEISNDGDIGKEVSIRIPLPYGIDKEISIEDKITPQPFSVDKSRIATWNLKFSPGESMKINLRFKIVYPKSKRITGIENY